MKLTANDYSEKDIMILIREWTELTQKEFAQSVGRNEREKTGTQIGIRVTQSFKNRLEARAKEERRSVSNLIIKVMEEYLDR